MKKTSSYLWVAALLCLSTLSGCDKDDKDPSLTLTVDSENIDVDYQLSKREIAVTTNVTGWSAAVEFIDQKEALWCSVSKSKGKLTVRIQENYKKSERKCIITLSAKGVTPVTINVTQGPANVERDPFYSDFGGVQWNDAWTLYTFMHNNNKFDPFNYEEGAGGSYKIVTFKENITVGLKLDAAFLAEFGNKSVFRMELRQNGPANVTFAILKKKALIPNTGTYPEYITETYTTEEIWRSETIAHPADTNWVICDSQGEGTNNANPLNVALTADMEEVFMVAYIETAGATPFIYAEQVLNKVLPTYVSFDGVSGQNLYKFIGGTCLINFYIQ